MESVKDRVRQVNYPDLPRSGLPDPRLLGSGLPVSVSELASGVDTAAPDSAGGFPSRAVWSVSLLPVGHSATPGGAGFLSRLNAAGGVASIFLPPSTGGGVTVAEKRPCQPCGRCLPSLLRPLRSLRGGRGSSALATEANPLLSVVTWAMWPGSRFPRSLEELVEQFPLSRPEVVQQRRASDVQRLGDFLGATAPW